MTGGPLSRKKDSLYLVWAIYKLKIVASIGGSEALQFPVVPTIAFVLTRRLRKIIMPTVYCKKQLTAEYMRLW